MRGLRLTHGGDARGGRVGSVGSERRVGLRLVESRGRAQAQAPSRGTGELRVERGLLGQRGWAAGRERRAVALR
jgi:hypothetical protein